MTWYGLVASGMTPAAAAAYLADALDKGIMESDGEGRKDFQPLEMLSFFPVKNKMLRKGRIEADVSTQHPQNQKITALVTSHFFVSSPA